MADEIKISTVKNWIAEIANVSAVALICLMFFMNNREQANLIQEERKMFREELKDITKEIHELRRVVEKLK